MRVAALDDEEIELELIKHTMLAMGHECVTFSDGTLLLRAMNREVFDVLLLDWQMPGISGLDVVRWARENLEKRVPILFITNRNDERDVVDALTAGADDFMVKPLRVRELMARECLGAACLSAQQAKSYIWQLPVYSLENASHGQRQGRRSEEKRVRLGVLSFQKCRSTAIARSPARTHLERRRQRQVTLTGYTFVQNSEQAPLAP